MALNKNNDVSWIRSSNSFQSKTKLSFTLSDLFVIAFAGAIPSIALSFILYTMQSRWCNIKQKIRISFSCCFVRLPLHFRFKMNPGFIIAFCFQHLALRWPRKPTPPNLNTSILNKNHRFVHMEFYFFLDLLTRSVAKKTTSPE